MITVVVYFHGPQTDWGSKIADREIIARHDVPFVWLARMKAKTLTRGLNAGHCGWALLRDGELIEKHEAEEIDLGPVPAQFR